MKTDLTYFKSKNRSGGVYYDKGLPPSMSTAEESKYESYFGPAPKNGNIKKTFGYHYMTDVEISYLRGLVREYKHVSTHEARREEIWRALNWAPISEQFVNVISPKQSDASADSNNDGLPYHPIDLIKWKIGTLAIGFSDTNIRDLEIEMEAVLAKPRLEYVMFKKGLISHKPNQNYLNSEPIIGTLELIKNVRPEIINFDFIKSMINDGILTYVPTFVLPIHPSLPWEESSYTSPFNFSGFTENDRLFYGKVQVLLGDEDPDETPFVTFGMSKPLDYGTVGDLDQIIKLKKYNNKRISDQELVFHIRLKYGFAFYNSDTEYAATDKIIPCGLTMPPPDQLARLDLDDVYDAGMYYAYPESKEYLEMYKEYKDEFQKFRYENGFSLTDISTNNYYSVMFFNDELKRHANHGEKLPNPTGLYTTVLKDKDITQQINEILLGATLADPSWTMVPAAATYEREIQDYNTILSQIISANNYLKEANKKRRLIFFSLKDVTDSQGNTITVADKLLFTETNQNYFDKVLYGDGIKPSYLDDTIEYEKYLKMRGIPYKINQYGYPDIGYQWWGLPTSLYEVEFALPSWNQLIPMSTILAYWRAHKLLQNLEDFSIYLEDALESKKALAVVGNITPPSDKIDPEYINSDLKNIKKTSQELFFISGTSIPSGNPNDERPWRVLFERANHEFGSSFYDEDREVRNPTNSCIPTKQYMRHQLRPKIDIYIAKDLYDDKELTATKIAIDKIYGIHSKMVKHYFGDDGLPEVLRAYLYEPRTGKVAINKQYSIIAKFFKGTKQWVFWVILSIVILFELVGLWNHALHDLMQILAAIFESLLVGFKSAANISLEYWTRLLIDLLAGIIGLTLSFKYQLPWVGIGLTVIIFTSYLFYDGSKELKYRENFLKLVEEATVKNVIEGPYVQSDGVVEIPKNKNGQIPIKTKYNKNTKTWENEYDTFQVVSTEPQTIEEINRQFLLPGGDGDKKFFNQLTCDEKNQILRIANANADPNTGELRGGKYNPILNSSPNHYDVGAFNLVDSLQTEPAGFGVDAYGFYIAFPHWENQTIIEDETRRLTKTNRGTAENKTSTVTFRYFLSKIERSDDLSPYFKKQKEPTLADFKVILTRNAGKIAKKIYDKTKPLTDKEIIWLIRRKYKLDRVVNFKDCCTMFNVPVDDQTYPSNTDCQYMIDFTSSEFIQRVIDSPGCNNSDKRTENTIPEDDRSSTYQPVNQHGMTEEAKVKKTINDETKKNEEEDRKRKKKDRRNKKRKQTKKVPPREEGSNDLQHNLNNFPKPGLIPQIPGTNNLGLSTDASNTQTINYETLVNSDVSVGRKLGNLAISIMAGYVQEATDAKYADVFQYASSTPLAPGPNIFRGRVRKDQLESFVSSIYNPGFGVVVKYASRRSYIRLLSDLPRTRFG